MLLRKHSVDHSLANNSAYYLGKDRTPHVMRLLLRKIRCSTRQQSRDSVRSRVNNNPGFSIAPRFASGSRGNEARLYAGQASLQSVRWYDSHTLWPCVVGFLENDGRNRFCDGSVFVNSENVEDVALAFGNRCAATRGESIEIFLIAG
jgi:hypothetical protein